MTLTGILLRHNGGHRYIGSPTGAERFIRIDTDNEDLAVQLCEEYLELHAGNTSTLATTARVLGSGQVPSHDYRVGDNVDDRPLATFAVSMADEAGADVGLELGDRLDQRLADLDRRIARASRGVVSSAAAPQINDSPQAKGNDKSLPIFSLGTVIYPQRSPAWAVSQPCWITMLEVTLEQPGESDSLIRLWKNARLAGECWIRAGEKRAVNKIRWQTHGLGFEPRDFMIMEVKVAGTDAANLAVVPHGAITGD